MSTPPLTVVGVADWLESDTVMDGWVRGGIRGDGSVGACFSEVVVELV